jgi:enoyl-CoA hydratase/carnithine racemase
LLADDAVAKGFIDQAVEADDLLPSAQKMAEKLASIDGKNFRLAKAMLRSETLQRMDAGAKDLNPAVFARWTEPEVLEGIQRYMDKLSG